MIRQHNVPDRPTMREIGVMICVRGVVVDGRNEDNISQNGVVDKKDKQHS